LKDKTVPYCKRLIVNQPEATKKLLNHYLRRLTNLSGNNRSLYLPRLASEQFLDLHQVSQLNREKSFSIVESIIAAKKKIICPVVDARLESSNEAKQETEKLQRLDHFIFEERGSRDLHLGWPFVRGTHRRHLHPVSAAILSGGIGAG